MSNVFPLPELRWEDDRKETGALARLSTEAPREPWHIFLRDSFQWRAGEHIGLVGNTGAGKTTMLMNLLPLHRYVVVFATKPKDETMDTLLKHGYLRMKEWKPLDPRHFPRRVLWPDSLKLDSEEHQRKVFSHAFDRIYLEGGWTVAIDEMWWFDNMLNLGKDVKKYLLQARSLKISLLVGTQRPAWVPREIYTQSTHLFFWRTNDENDIRSLAGIGWRSNDLIRTIVANLERFQTLYINTRTGAMCRTRCPQIPGIGT